MASLSLSDDFDDISDPLATTMKTQTDEKEKKTESKKDSEQSKKTNSFSSSFDDFETQSAIASEGPKNETEKKEKSSEKIDLSFESFESESKKSENTDKSKADTVKSNKSNNKTTDTEKSNMKTDKSENKTQKADEKSIKDDKKSTQNSTIKPEQEKKVENKKETPTPQNEQKSKQEKKESFENVEIKPTEDEINYVPPKIRPMAPPSKPVPKEDPQDEINRLKELVMQQRHIIDSQKETIKLLMKEQINYEEMSKLRSALASKDPLLQLVAATPLSESRAMSDLRAENASLRREIDEIETRHLAEMKALRSQFAQMSARQMPQDGCAVCRRRIRELENQLKEKQ